MYLCFCLVSSVPLDCLEEIADRTKAVNLGIKANLVVA